MSKVALDKLKARFGAAVGRVIQGHMALLDEAALRQQFVGSMPISFQTPSGLLVCPLSARLPGMTFSTEGKCRVRLYTTS